MRTHPSKNDKFVTFGDNGHPENRIESFTIKSMKVERIYANELDSQPEILARNQRKLEKRLASHDELLSFLLNNLEKVQNELPMMEAHLKAVIATKTPAQVRQDESVRARMEPHLWALFRQRLLARLGKQLKAVPSEPS